MTLDSPVSELKGVGEQLASKLKRLKVNTVQELIDYLPRRYDDYSVVTAVKDLQPGTVTIKATIDRASGRYVRRGIHITEATASDQSGSVRLTWFNQSYRAVSLKPDAEYYITGPYELKYQRFAITSPSVELVSDFPVSAARIVPVYRETKGLSSLQLRRLIRAVEPLISSLPETLPQWLLQKHHLLPYAETIQAMHFPANADQLQKAKKRYGYEEVFCLTLSSLLNKQANAKDIAISVLFDLQLAKQFVSHLPFKLTDAQRTAVWQIYQDIEKTRPMNRLLEGDVGSGKTVVAAMAAVMAIKQGYQVALMAPTELLARQHSETIYNLLKPLGLEHQLGLLTGSFKPAQKRSVHKRIASGDLRMVVGTHSLLSDNVQWHNLAMVIVDEQHRFGVQQRKVLQMRADKMPHSLHMTATPIPRSLALTLFGELDVSILKVKPGGRRSVITQLISPNSREPMLKTLLAELASGRQAFVVCPTIIGSKNNKQVSAEQTYEQLIRGELKDWRVGLLHSKLKADDKTRIMAQFIDHRLDVLVSTTVIEVGVDIPNASVMIIEGAERFGLAQIHQLRGRVGRSEQQGYCFLIDGSSQTVSTRLRVLERTNDGFRLAELDLRLRGPGAIYGALQHGVLDLRVAQLSDTKLIANARADAQVFIDKGENLLHYPQLAVRVQNLRAVTTLN